MISCSTVQEAGAKREKEKRKKKKKGKERKREGGKDHETVRRHN